MHSKFLIWVSLVLAVHAAGCGKAAPRRMKFPHASWAEKKVSLERQKKIETMRKVIEAHLTEFDKDMEKLKKRNPFIPPGVTTKAKESELTLGGIIWDEKTPAAIINDTIVGIGDSVANKVVKQIMKDEVVLMEGEKEYRLKLKFE